MNLIAPIIIVATVSSTYYGIQNYQTLKQKEELKIVKRIDDKVNNLKDYVLVSNLDNANSIVVDDSAIVQSSNRISHLLVPGTKASKYDEVLLDKHFKATVKYFKDNATSVAPTCADLITTSLITLDECNYISTKEFEFFTYDNGKIEYTVPATVASKVKSLSKANTLTEIDANSSKITNNDYFINSEFMERKIYDLTFKYNQLINEQIKEGNIDHAKDINSKLAEFNPEASQANITKNSW